MIQKRNLSFSILKNLKNENIFFSSCRVLAVRCGPQAAHPQVFLATYPRADAEKNHILKDGRWEQLNAPFEEVRLEKMEGRNFLNRMELLMAALTSPTPVH